eukprot:scaffold41711_cov197-Isochrysis_galbana.AAC.2
MESAKLRTEIASPGRLGACWLCASNRASTSRGLVPGRSASTTREREPRSSRPSSVACCFRIASSARRPVPDLALRSEASRIAEESDLPDI